MKSVFRTLFVFLSATVTAPMAFAGLQELVSNDVLAPLSRPMSIGGKVRLEHFPLDNKVETLELERFEVYADDAELITYGANRQIIERTEKPDIKLYRGRLASDPDSLVFISVSKARVDGLIYKGDRHFGFVSRPRLQRHAARESDAFDVFIEESTPMEDLANDGKGFVCELDKTPLIGRPRLTQQPNGLPGTPAVDGAISGNGKWVLNLAIDTDFELYTNVGSTTGNVDTYITNLVGAASAVYSRDLSTDLVVTYRGIQTTSSDPFTINPGSSGTWNGSPTTFSTSHALAEFGDYWHNTPPSANPRSSTILVSGKSQTAGVAWIGTICTGDFSCTGGNCGSALFDGHTGGRYAYVGGIFPPAGLAVGTNTTPPYTAPSSNYWPLLEFTHEFGHNVQSGHTHCIVLSPGDQSLYGRTYVDNCYSAEGGCFSGTATVPAEKGTIMSYCHLRSGGGPNLRFTFGQPGEASHIVPENMRSAISTKTPVQPSVTAPASMITGASGVASITPVAGLTYNWTVTNGAINTGQGTSSVNFTATTNPTRVKVTATNASGCSITNYVDIPLIASGIKGDTDGDTRADIVWRKDAGDNSIWFIQANLSVNFVLLPTTDPSWQIVSTGDYNGDGKTDLFWRNSTTNDCYIWLLNGGTILSYPYYGAPDSTWSVKGSADLDGNGFDDLIWRNTAGTMSVWMMFAGTLQALSLPSPDNSWTIAGFGDLNGDGKDDIIWRNLTSYLVSLWQMNGTSVTALPLPAVDPSWTLAGVGDFGGDGKADLFWRHAGDGVNSQWQMNGNQVTALPMPTAPDSNYKVQGCADFSGDGRADLVWRHDTNGLNFLWQISGNLVNSISLPSAPDPTWRIRSPK